MQRFDATGYQPDALPDLTRRGRTLILCRPNSSALETMRHTLPLNGDYRIVDETTFQDGAALLRSADRDGFDKIGFLNPYGNEHRLELYNSVRRAGLSYWVFDRGALPNSWFFDNNGFNADSGTYDPKNWNIELSEADHAYVRDYIRSLKQSGSTLEKNGTSKSGEYWRGKLGVGHRKVLFVPLQRPSDTVTRYFNGRVGPYENFYLWIASIAAALDPSEWVVVCKKHPLETVRPDIPNTVFVPDGTHVHDLIELCDAVLLLNSGVGVLALAFGKAVIACGQAFYAHDGLAASASSPENAVELIQSAVLDDEKVERFLHYLLTQVYSFGETFYTERKQPDGSLFTAARQIKFESIRGFGEPVFLGQPRPPVPLDSILFATFGGNETIERARKSPFLAKPSQKFIKPEGKVFATASEVAADTAVTKPDPNRVLGARELIQLGYADFHAGRFDAAASRFGQAYEKDPSNINVLRCEAEALWSAGKRDEALHRLKIAKSRLPKNKRLKARYAVVKMPWLKNVIGSREFKVPQPSLV